MVPVTALLSPFDFESARGRAGLLLQRDLWFANGPASPSANHMWPIWDAGRGHSRPPIVHYEAESDLPARRRRLPFLVATNASGRGVTAVVSSKGLNDDE